jgi:omega-6 fatty acid desaturase (delta-12 desaturase)
MAPCPPDLLRRRSIARNAKRLRGVLVRFQKPSTARALWQFFNTIIPYVLLWVLMWFVKDVSLWLAAALAMLAGTLLVRVFIFFHDCGHGSFFKSHWANAIFGFICGVLTFTPYYHWRWQHAIHHGTSSHWTSAESGTSGP